MTDRVAVVGAGQMGNGIAHVFAQSGFLVTMIDVSQEALAQITSMASFTVCRILTNWENQGLLKLRREVIEIHNVPRLLGLCKTR